METNPMETFTFKVCLFNAAIRDLPAATLEANKDKIIEWYNNSDYIIIDDGSVIKKLNVSHVSGNTFNIELERGPDGTDDKVRFDLDMFVDIDQDGNHPIKIDGISYLVSGELM